jgi:large subunit ribosomal protein L9
MEEIERVRELAGKLEGFLCLIEMRATETGHLFGSVGPEHVADALADSGFEALRPANISMAEHIEQVGDYEVELILHPQVRVTITVRVAPLGSNEDTAEVE